MGWRQGGEHLPLRGQYGKDVGRRKTGCGPERWSGSCRNRPGTHRTGQGSRRREGRGKVEAGHRLRCVPRLCCGCVLCALAESPHTGVHSQTCNRASSWAGGGCDRRGVVSTVGLARWWGGGSTVGEARVAAGRQFRISHTLAEAGGFRRGGVAGAEPPHKGGPNRPDRKTAVVSGQWLVVSWLGVGWGGWSRFSYCWRSSKRMAWTTLGPWTPVVRLPSRSADLLAPVMMERLRLWRR